MKKILLLVALAGSYPCCAQNLIDQYLTGTPVYTTVAGSANNINQPRDLDFKPFSNELWVANKGTSAGGSMVIIYNAGMTGQSSQHRKDSHTGHFMMYPSGIAFGDDGRFTTSNEIKNTADPASTFMGPTLWSSDTNVYARVFQNDWEGYKPLGSHLDMLHQSPFSMGVAHDSGATYWVADGHNGNICKYNFSGDHSPGYDDHSDGLIWRYTDVIIGRLPNMPGHMIKDKETGWLYFIDASSKQLKRMQTNSGSISGTLNVPSTSPEALDGYWAVTGAQVELIEDFPSSQPCGVDVYNGRMVVSDNATGDIYVYDITGSAPVKTGTIATGQIGIMGVKIGPDGKIWFVNETQSKVVRIDPATLVTNDAAIEAIVAPVMMNYEPHFYNPRFNYCTSNITPQAILKNTGTNTLTSAEVSFDLDNSFSYNYTWTGSLAPGATATVNLMSLNLYGGNHKLEIFVTEANGVPDNNPANNRKDGSFRVLADAQYPFTEDFSSSTFPPQGWTYIAHNFNNEMNHHATGGFGLSTGSVKMDNYSGSTDITGQKDYLMLPRIDMSSADNNAALRFSVANARYDANTNDGLAVMVSTDCGANWTSLYNKQGAALATADPNENEFTPTAGQWREETISLASVAGQDDVVLMFVTTSGFGNNLYLDDIRIADPTSVTGLEKEAAFRMYPNPTTGRLFIEQSTASDISIYSMQGMLVRSFSNIKSGRQELDLSGLSEGTYVVRVAAEGKLEQRKVVVTGN